MSPITSTGINARAIQTDSPVRSEVTDNTRRTHEPHDESMSGLGALAGKHISVGDGKQRSQATASADQAKSLFKSAPTQIAAGVGRFVAAVPVGIARVAVHGITFLARLINEKILAPRADKRFENAHADTLAQLRTPMKDGVAANPHVMDRVYAHAMAAKTPLDASQLRHLVAAGERIAHVLSQASSTTRGSAGQASQHAMQAHAGSPVHLDVNGQQAQVASSTYTTRALSWYMVAAAAQQDTTRAQMGEKNGTTDMARATTFILKDPGNAMHRFLSAQPQAANGVIADARKYLPGSSASMHLSKLSANDKTDELSVQFSSQADSRSAPPSWGALDENVARPLAALVQTAMSNGTIDTDAKTFDSSVEKFGMPYVHAALDRIQDAATARNDLKVLGQVTALRGTIAAQSAQLGLTSDRHGIERRGTEVHISLNPTDNVRPSIKGTLTGPQADKFENELINLRAGNRGLNQDYAFKNGTAKQPICQQFGIDVMRQNTVIDGDLVIKADQAEKTAMHAARQLREMTGSDAQAKLVSQYANQTSMAPIVELMMLSDELPLYLPDGRKGTPPGGDTTFSAFKDKDGSILLTGELSFPRLARLNVMSPETGMESANLDPDRSHMKFSFTLRLGTDDSVRLAQPLTYEVSIHTKNENA